VIYLYTGAACLVGAQLLGIYALVTRKADLIFSLVMVALVVAAFFLAAFGAYSQLA
jgi:hypothetical protein